MVIYNNIIPFKGFKAINLFGLIFVRKGSKFGIIDKSHEQIHTELMKELLYLPFYIIYLFEWLFLLFKYFDSRKAYKNISFEKEAYTYEEDLGYLKRRKHFAQWRR